MKYDTCSFLLARSFAVHVHLRSCIVLHRALYSPRTITPKNTRTGPENRVRNRHTPPVVVVMVATCSKVVQNETE